MRRAHARKVRLVLCALGLLAPVGCSWLHHGQRNKPHCPEPAVVGDTRNMPPLRVPPGLDAPDTRNAIKIPPLTEPRPSASAYACLSEPPSFGGQLAAYTGPSAPSGPGSFSWHVNGGAARTLGATSDYLGNGWTIGGGVSYQRKPQSRFALQLDLGYADFNANSTLVNLAQQNVHYAIDGGNGHVWSLTAAGKFTMPFSPNVQAYGLLGIGGYHESLQLTETALYGGVICDPWGYCYAVATEGDIVLASRSLTKFGWSVGLGVEFPRRSGSAWFIETRYHSVNGNKQSVEFLPIQIGYRF